MSLRTLARRLPSPVYRALQRLYRRLRPAPIAAIPNPGPLVTDIAPRLGAIPGWLNLDDAAHFTLVLGAQRAAGIRGDLLEIGCFHGRSAALLALHLAPRERLVLVDVFDLPGDEPYGDRPAPEGVRANLARACPGLDQERVTILRADSRTLTLPAEGQFRFAHIDGGHGAATVAADLATCAARMRPGGVIVVDDYAHPLYPGVTEGTDAFLAGEPGWRPIADLNRAGALGRKLYLARDPAGDLPEDSGPDPIGAPP